MPNSGAAGASFRDPSGFIFRRGGALYRQVNQAYRAEYDQLINSGLYHKLVERGWLVAHQETAVDAADPALAYKVIQPAALDFISYPYEWCFSQLKDAALLTLNIARLALEHGMILKDASAYNIQFHDGKPLLIDTLSFDLYREGEPWVAYRQFCQHFLAPLALAAHVDIRLTQLLRAHIDGVPLDLASRLLPGKTRLDLGGLGVYIHMHAGMQARYAAENAAPAAAVKLPKAQLLGILGGLERALNKLVWQPAGTEWGDYYSATNYTDEALRKKGEIVGAFIDEVKPSSVWDLGGNTGLFSREASRRGIFTIASDIDPAAVEKDYLAVKANGEKRLLPLVVDLTNPSPAIGWANQERDSLTARGPAGMVLALALVHHLAISNNVPLERVAAYFASLGEWAVVEFIPKADSQVQRLLATRKDIFTRYHEAGFEAAMQTCFSVEKKVPVPVSKRTLYLLKRS